MVQLLLENGANVQARGGDFLQEAVQIGNEKIVRLLLENSSLGKFSKAGFASLAKRERHKEVAELFREGHSRVGRAFIRALASVR